MLFFNNYKRIKGFTLVESLVAISILMVAIVTPMTIAQNGLGSATYSKDQTTAAFLAQDALEFIKNKRDEIGLRKVAIAATSSSGWLGENNAVSSLKNIFDYCASSDGSKKCYVDTITGDISNTEANIYINRKVSTAVFLYYGNPKLSGTIQNEKSKFIRSVSIKIPAVSLAAGGSNDEALVTVKVSWLNKTTQESVEIKNFIYNYWENI